MNEQEQMLMEIKGCRRVDLHTTALKLDENENNKLEKMLRRRSQGEPLQYILGHVDFMGLRLKVNKDVLIPRPETEILCESLIKLIKNDEGPSSVNILDLGTGSGNITITLAHFLSQAHITSVDISKDALTLAQENAVEHKVNKQIEWVHDDMDSFLWSLAHQQRHFDVIVSNPPYIRSNDLLSLPSDVQQEPFVALDGGEDGLSYYRKIIKSGCDCLKPKGILCFEIGDGQENDIINMFHHTECFDMIDVIKDYTQTSRILIARYKG